MGHARTEGKSHMEGPDREFRERIANRIDGLEAADDPEDELDNILAQIQELAALDRPGELAPGDEEAAYQELAAIEAWASLASNAVQALYEARSPSLLDRAKQKLGLVKEAGWSKRAPERLRGIARSLEPRLRAVCRVLAGVGFAVGVAFPGGISVSISYTI